MFHLPIFLKIFEHVYSGNATSAVPLTLHYFTPLRNAFGAATIAARFNIKYQKVFDANWVSSGKHSFPVRR